MVSSLLLQTARYGGKTPKYLAGVAGNIEQKPDQLCEVAFSPINPARLHAQDALRNEVYLAA
jgi:hypothetical protein